MSSRKEALSHTLVTVDTEKGLDGLFETLASLSEVDADFNGDNGISYLWEEAIGFESNKDYCLNEVKKLESQVNMVNAFIDMWLGNDDYYGQYKVLCALNDKDEVTHISLAYISGC